MARSPREIDCGCGRVMPEDVARPLARRRRAETTALPPWTKPQLTKLVDQPPEGSEWLHELKFDGCPRHCQVEAF
jgi:ATP-dependent DNA ligase